MSSRRVHLNSQVATRPSERVLLTMDTFYRDRWNQLDLYRDIEASMKDIYRLFEADSAFHFHLTPGGFPAMQHLLLHFYLNEVRVSGKNHFLSSTVEEAPILKALSQMELIGCGVKFVSVNEKGQIDLNKLKELIGPKTSLISISAVCAMTGVLQPIPEIVEICHAKGVKVHVNATHAIGTWGVSLKEWPVDYLTFDGDKMGTPPGVGGLFAREPLQDCMHSAPLLLGLAEAIREATARQEQFAMEMARLRHQFEEELLKTVGDCVVIAREEERVPHIFALSFAGLMNEALLYALHLRHVDASIGGGQFQTLTALLKQWGCLDSVALGSISFALSYGIQEDDLARALDAIVSSVRALRKMSAVL